MGLFLRRQAFSTGTGKKSGRELIPPDREGEISQQTENGDDRHQNNPKSPLFAAKGLVDDAGDGARQDGKPNQEGGDPHLGGQLAHLEGKAVENFAH